MEQIQVALKLINAGHGKNAEESIVKVNRLALTEKEQRSLQILYAMTKEDILKFPKDLYLLNDGSLLTGEAYKFAPAMKGSLSELRLRLNEFLDQHENQVKKHGESLAVSHHFS